MFKTNISIYFPMLTKQGEYDYLSVSDGFFKYAELTLTIEEAEKSFYSSQGIKISKKSMFLISEKLKKGLFVLVESNVSHDEVIKYVKNNHFLVCENLEIMGIDGHGSDCNV